MYRIFIIPEDTKVIVQEKAFSIGNKVRQHSAVGIDTKIDMGSVEAIDHEGKAILIKYDIMGRSVTKWCLMQYCRVIHV